MAAYYCLMAGAPSLALDSSPAPITTAQFRQDLDEEITPPDARLLSYLYMQQDALNTAALLADADASVGDGGNYSEEQLREMILCAQSTGADAEGFPHFLCAFAQDYPTLCERDGYYPKDDILDRYYRWALTCPNDKMRRWFSLCLNINNVLTALVAKSMGWNIGGYIQGTDAENLTSPGGGASSGSQGVESADVAEMLLTNSAKDFGLSTLYDWAEAAVRISEEQNPTRKEQRIDALKWAWLDDNMLDDEFSVEAVFAYLCKLAMLQRWELLDPQRGKETFTRIIEDLRGGAKVPAEFVAPTRGSVAR